MSDEFQPRAVSEIETLKRLEGIFLPHSSVLREGKRQADNPGQPPSRDNRGKFVHYTSAEAALKIIRTRRLWMRSTTCMADYGEVQHGYRLLTTYFRQPEKHTAFFAAMDSICPDIARAAFAAFDQWWSTIRTNTYITSVSEHGSSKEDQFGRLSMWRSFGAGQPRVALVFSIPWESQASLALNMTFGPVSYLAEFAAHGNLDLCVAKVKQEADWLRAVPADQFRAALFQMLATTVCCQKHEGFWEEREWRGVYLHGFGHPTLLERSSEVIGGLPQPIFKIPLDASVSPHLIDLDLTNSLSRIIIGPTSYSWVVYEAFVEALSGAGISEPQAKVWASNLPIRES
ncbi:MAG TPA: hypothetical protein VJ750_05110 [Rhizomicrobium sp.]|nr:hypothetical protein [Rhizomicrobium sp.]